MKNTESAVYEYEQRQLAVRKKVVARTPAKLSPLEKSVIDAPILRLVNEFKNIQKKESKISAHLRSVVVLRIEFLIKKGFINSKEELLLCSHPFYDFKECYLIKDRKCIDCKFVLIIDDKTTLND